MGIKKGNIIIVRAFIVLVMLALLGGIIFLQQKVEPEQKKSDEANLSRNQTLPGEENQSDTDENDTEPSDSVDTECGDGVCEGDEDCASCSADCTCPEGHSCVQALGKCAPDTACGNGRCEEGEDCSSCSRDCGCSDGAYCDEDTGECVTPECGNGVCEKFESERNCCADCGCPEPYMSCDEESGECQMPEPSIARAKAEQKAKDYCSTEQEHSVSTIGEVTTVYQDEMPGYRVEVYGESSNSPCVVVVLENGDTEHMPVW